MGEEREGCRKIQDRISICNTLGVGAFRYSRKIFYCWTVAVMGVWCSGITSASHAEDPGFGPRRLHLVCTHASPLPPVALLRNSQPILAPRIELGTLCV
jgi:hypothetical protein